MESNLKPISINELYNKQFFIPKYQRGYRWINLQVEQLLDDIDSFVPREINDKPNEKTFYCLQPLVLKLMNTEECFEHNLKGEWFEVIDGQQRLTTILIILQYINQKWAGEDKLPLFSLKYDTRRDCEEFLKNLRVKNDDTVSLNKSNIDYYHITQALGTIRKWQLDYQSNKKKPFNSMKFRSTFEEYAKLIWYKVNPDQKGQLLFERLNMGKIPLTNAELVKALFLSSESFSDLLAEDKKIKQFEIAKLWDQIEHHLNEPDKKFWSFITNKRREDYETKIDLILDAISGKSDEEKNEFYTFLTFTDKQKEGGLTKVWHEIEHFYYTLCEWFTDKNYYHKIGYLITAKQTRNYKGIDLGQLVKNARLINKLHFDAQLNEQIIASVKAELSELSYEKDYNQIFNILLLFNVETVRTSRSISDFYPFKQHKDNIWSLEHIHARKSDFFDRSKKEPWIDWLKLHNSLLKENQLIDIRTENLIFKIDKILSEGVSWEKFLMIHKEVNDYFTTDIESMDLESEGICNLALLSQPDNSALNNSVFEIKRREIIKLDKEGSFIPICTRQAFMKYYIDEQSNEQIYFWSKQDRSSYLNVINKTLQIYLPINHIENDEN